MWKNENSLQPSVLIVENQKGDVFIVENKETNQIDKILGKDNAFKDPKENSSSPLKL
jgi:hypothetical protein